MIGFKSCNSTSFRQYPYHTAWELILTASHSPDGTTAEPIEGPSITLSPLSFWHRDQASFVFRCTKCDVAGSVADGKVQLGALFSHIRPPFVVGRTNETVTMTNATIAPFSMDLQDIVRRDFAEVLRGTGLE